MKHSVIRHCRAAATSFVLVAAAFAAAADPATNAPAVSEPHATPALHAESAEGAKEPAP